MDMENSKNCAHHLQEMGASSSRRSSPSRLAATTADKIDDNSPKINPQPISQSATRQQPLTTHQALVRLHEDINQEVTRMKLEFSKRTFISWVLESISFKSELSKMRWPSVLFMTAHAIAHFIVAFVLNVENLATNWIGFQGFILFGLLVFNLAVNLWDTSLRFKELLMKSEQIGDLIYKCSQDKHLIRRWKQFSWRSVDAKTLFIPKSPCVHQTLTYRDKSCLNLPDYLLVKGDIIHLFPGERAPGECISLKTINDDENDNTNRAESGDKFGGISLQDGEIFHPSPSSSTNKKQDSKSVPSGLLFGDEDVIAHARLKKATLGTDFLMLSTPYLKSLRISLQRSHKRPVNSIEKECFIVSRKYFETYVIPSVFILSTIVTAIHYGYLDLTDSDQQIKTISIAYLLLRPSLTIMPFLPWMFPCFWMAINAYGSARLLCCAELQRNKTAKDQIIAAGNGDGNNWADLSPNEWNQRGPGHGLGNGVGGKPSETSNFVNLLATPTAAGSSEHNKHDEDLQDLQSNINFMSIFWVFVDLIRGKSGHIWRSSSLLQVLGCLTSLCCIDKVGILSWSNPTPEKVFVLTSANNDEGATHQLLSAPQSNQSDDQETSSQNQATPNGSQPQTLMSINGPLKGSCQEDQLSNQNLRVHLATNKTHHMFSSQARPEILDVSQTFNTFRGFHESMSFHQGSRLQFDDLNWVRYLNNLKPLGLAIMMNNCCEKSFGDYFRFYKHISFESTLRCNLTPVVKRRCLCGLSELVGFSRQAVKNYNYVNQIGAYKLIDPSTIKEGTKLVSALENTTRLKLPFPNMICNIHRDTTSGSYQVFSQGTADVILDSCVEFWDGKQLTPLDDSARKKIKDFYHRTSLTSYCSAFSYTPLLNSHNLGDHYIELPSENSKLSHHQMRKLTNDQHEDYLRKQMIYMPKQQCRPTNTFESQQNLTRPIYNHPGSNLSSQDNMQLNFEVTQHYFDDQPLPLARSPQTMSHVLRRHLSAEIVDDYKLRHEKKQAAQVNYGQQCPMSESRLAAKSRKLNEALDELTDQVFVGMVTMQYQACPDFVCLVEQLEHACIRFVHFSKENELRSRVFSEKMGLESGWNCHVSLQSDQDLDKAYRCKEGPAGGVGGATGLSRVMNIKGDGEPQIGRRQDDSGCFTPSGRVSDVLMGTGNKLSRNHHRNVQTVDSFNEANSNGAATGRQSISSDERTLYSWQSLPSLVMQVIARVSSNIGKHNHHHNHQTPKTGFNNEPTSSASTGDELFQGSEYGDAESGLHDQEATESSTKDEGFDAIAFDMSNRAKLPKGIENIRPHLETVDNIPLQVSLFTDCTPSLTKEMIEIMQDYGEIVCVIGSSSSNLNTPVFLQANASIAIEPLMPRCCTKCCKEKKKKSSSRGRKSRSRANKRARGSRKQRSERYKQRSSSPAAVDEQVESGDFTAIQVFPRPSNPRDRLGIGPTTEQPTSEQLRGKRRHHQASTSSESSDSEQEPTLSSSTSSSSSSTATRSSSSSSSSSKSRSTSKEDGIGYSSDEHQSERPDNEEDDDDDYDGQLGGSAESLSGSSCQLSREFPEPSALASRLASLPCCYSYNRQEQVNLYSLIMEARHFTFKMKNTFVCMICFALSISSAQFLASILFLPPMLSSGLTIWLTVVVVPLMSFSLMSTTMDSQVMKMAVGKNLQLKPENITFFVICYLIKFIPSIIVVVLNFGLIIAHSCKLTGFGSSSLGPCWMFTYVQHGNATSSAEADEDLLWSSHLLTAQVSAAFLMVLYFVVISAGFVHRSHSWWQRSPTRNHFWVIISLTLIIGQLFYNQLVLRVNLNSSKIPYEFLATLPFHIWLISFMWPIILIGINLLVKRAELKAIIRQQRRARFDFNTKLGMNSPF